MRLALLPALCVLVACGNEAAPQRTVNIAAASNLTRIMPAVAEAFRAQSGVTAVVSYGSTAQLAMQIRNGAPFEVFLAADTEHVSPQNGFIYARGRLVIWAPRHPEVRSFADLALPAIRTIAIAKPELAPYGKAAHDVLVHQGLWDKLESRIVYASSISSAKQLAATGNADAAFIAQSLLGAHDSAYVPTGISIPQAGAITKDSPAARAFMTFLRTEQAKQTLRNGGYDTD